RAERLELPDSGRYVEDVARHRAEDPGLGVGQPRVAPDRRGDAPHHHLGLPGLEVEDRCACHRTVFALRPSPPQTSGGPATVFCPPPKPRRGDVAMQMDDMILVSIDDHMIEPPDMYK